VNGMLNKLRALANLIMICVAVERTFAALKRDRHLQQAQRRKINPRR
jgi:hypothetical protein